MNLLKWKLANLFSRWAIILRGNRVYAFSFSILGNEAAKVADDIHVSMILEDFHKSERYQETLRNLMRLEQMAGAAWFHPSSPAETEEAFNTAHKPNEAAR